MTDSANKTYDVQLVATELLLLDGKVSEKTQAIINKMKAENSYGFDFPLIGEVLRKSEEKGKLTWGHKRIRSCPYCDKKYDYVQYPRNSATHSKGDKNYDKPIYYNGIEFHPGIVNVIGVGDICTDCAAKYHVLQSAIDYILDNDLRVEIQKNDYRDSEYFYDEESECFKCHQPMWESEMGRSRTVFDNGTYPSTCPHCGAESKMFGSSHKTTKNFRLVKGDLKLFQGNRPASHVPVQSEEALQ